MVFRCTLAEKAVLLDRADQAGVSLSRLMREALGLVETRRRRPALKADPRLLREIGRVGGELQHIAKWLEAADAGDDRRHAIDALAVAANLVAIERSLWSIAVRSASQHTDQPQC